MVLWRNKKGENRVYKLEKVVSSVFITMNILTEGIGIKSDAKTSKQISLCFLTYELLSVYLTQLEVSTAANFSGLPF